MVRVVTEFHGRQYVTAGRSQAISGDGKLVSPSFA